MQKEMNVFKMIIDKAPKELIEHPLGEFCVSEHSLMQIAKKKVFNDEPLSDVKVEVDEIRVEGFRVVAVDWIQSSDSVMLAVKNSDIFPMMEYGPKHKKEIAELYKGLYKGMSSQQIKRFNI